MKMYLAAVALALGLAGQAHAQAYGSGVDGQSIFRVSNTLAPITYSSGSTVTPKLASDTRIIRISCSTDCHINRGATSGVAATASNTMLFSGATEYFRVTPGLANYFAVTRDSADGKFYLDEMAP